MKNVNAVSKSRFHVPSSIVSLVLGIIALIATFASPVFPNASYIAGAMVSLVSLAHSLRSDSWGALRILTSMTAATGIAVGVTLALVAVAG